MAADISAPVAEVVDTALSIGFTAIDADAAIGSIATDSAITKAKATRAMRIIRSSDADIYSHRR